MLLLQERDRAALWRKLGEIIEGYVRDVTAHRVSPALDPEGLRAMLDDFDFSQPRDPISAVEWAAEMLWRQQVHTPHPRYFGLFNPAPTTMGIAADALVAAFNPQMAAWSHSPFAVEAERRLIRAFGERFGYPPASIDGTFTGGGAEANHTAMLAALTAAFSEFGLRGVRALAGQPVFYASVESHHSLLKAAGLCGIGRDALREVPVDDCLRMDPSALRAEIERDRADGSLPFLVAATAGATNSGAIDPLPQIAAIAAEHGLWFHVDAAWGGAAALCAELRPLLEGIERADSIAFDAHKWLSTPMGAGVFLTQRPDILDRTFRTMTAYMPREAAGLDVVDPHLHSMQWSRRFIGLKVFLSLAVAGWSGYEAAIAHMTAMGALLRRELQSSGWRLLNSTPLPVVCFADEQGAPPEEIVRRVVAGGEAWISSTLLARSIPAIRACITNYRTGPDDVRALAASLDRARATRAQPRAGE
jgi:glutamate/tyrosine decarboxylase-like PLP-dependent enzyme